MSIYGTLKDINSHYAKKQSLMVDAVTEKAPILDIMPFAPSSHGLWNAYEVVTDISGPAFVPLNSPLPQVDMSSDLRRVDLDIMGGQAEVPEDQARLMGGKEAYFAKKLPKILSRAGMDDVAALASLSSLVVMSGGGETLISEAATSEPLGPENVRGAESGAYGAEAIRPLKVGGACLFVQSGGRIVREISYDNLSLQATAPDMTLLAEHVTAPGIMACAYQQKPHSIAWYLLENNELAGFTRDAAQEVHAWHRHPLGGGARAESLASVPAQQGPDDELYIVAALEAAEGTRRFVCCLDAGHDRGGDITDAFFVDLGKTVESPVPVTEFTSLGHLEGCTVAVLADGGAHPDCVVRNGAITLQHPAKVVQAGLRYAFDIQTMFIEAGAQNGTAQSAKKLIRKPAPRVLESAGGSIYSPAEDRGFIPERSQAIFSRDARDDMDSPVSLVTGDIVDAPWPGGWERSGSVGIRHDAPLPFCLLALILTVETVDL